MLLLTAEQATRVQALAKEILETLEKSHHISLDAPAPVKPKAVAAFVVRKAAKRSRKNRKRLTEQQVAQIRSALKTATSKAAVAREFGIAYSTVFKISQDAVYKTVK